MLFIKELRWEWLKRVADIKHCFVLTKAVEAPSVLVSGSCQEDLEWSFNINFEGLGR